MIWRGIIILFANATVILLALAGFSWLEQGYGLNPLIAFPAAVLVFSWMWLWIATEASEAGIKIENYLEYLDRREWIITQIMSEELQTEHKLQIETTLDEIYKARDILS